MYVNVPQFSCVCLTNWDSVSKKALQWTPEDRHKQGTPKKHHVTHYRDRDEGLFPQLEPIQKLAWDRGLWKSFVGALCASGHDGQSVTSYITVVRIHSTVMTVFSGPTTLKVFWLIVGLSFLLKFYGPIR